MRKRSIPVTETKRRTTELIARLERSDLLEGIARGERAFAAGHVTSHTRARQRLGRSLGSPR